MSLTEIIDDSATKNYQPRKKTYKVDMSDMLENSVSAKSGISAQSANLNENFVTIQVKPYVFQGKKAVALTMLEVTEKIRNKLSKIQKREQHLKQ